jgi:hypothetical protein
VAGALVALLVALGHDAADQLAVHAVELGHGVLTQFLNAVPRRT